MILPLRESSLALIRILMCALLIRYSKRGARRGVECLPCVKSAVSGSSHGVCWDAPGSGRRCMRCSKGGKCEALPELASRASRRFLDALRAGNDKKVSHFGEGSLVRCGTRLTFS